MSHFDLFWVSDAFLTYLYSNMSLILTYHYFHIMNWTLDISVTNDVTACNSHPSKLWTWKASCKSDTSGLDTPGISRLPRVFPATFSWPESRWIQRPTGDGIMSQISKARCKKKTGGIWYILTHRIHVWYICLLMENVTIYGIHGSYGWYIPSEGDAKTSAGIMAENHFHELSITCLSGTLAPPFRSIQPAPSHFLASSWID